MTGSNQKIVPAAAGLDPSGGAGLLMDCLAIRAAGCLPFAVPTVLTVQDGVRFRSATCVHDAYLSDALRRVAAFKPPAFKIGALKSRAVVQRVSAFLRAEEIPNVVVDPVLVSTSGGRLLDEDAIAPLKWELFSRATLVTPNLAEAALLSELPVRDVAEMRRAAEQLLSFGPKAVLIKGGHLEGEGATDVLADDTGVYVLKSETKVGVEVRGTGCALSSLIAAHLARGQSVRDAVEHSREMLGRALRSAYPAFGVFHLGDFEV